jgi:TPR repeat protein
MPIRKAGLAMAASLLLAGCVGGRYDAAAPRQVCDSSGCTVRDATKGSFVPRDDATARPQPDADAYRGEDLAQLEADARGGSAAASYKLGLASLYGLAGSQRNAQRAAQYFAVAAEQGHAWAQYRLAQLYANGQGVGRDQTRAMQLTFAAARSGHAQAAHNLGLAFLQGRGLPADPAEAAHWTTVAAENGIAESQYNLGLMYYRGDGVGQQLYEALQWLRRSARGGYVPAQKVVGRLYMTGLDAMGQDIQEARTWLTLAAGKGDADARRWLAEIDRAEREEREFARQLQMQAAQTATYLAAAVLAAALAPPPTYVILY